MRAGGDRIEIGEQVFQLFFPQGAATVRGHSIGEEAAGITAREGEVVRRPGGLQWSPPIDDPLQNGRRIEISVQLIQDRAVAVIARFFSRDRMDIDAAWRPIKEHLDRRHGQPAREVSGLLKLLWTVQGAAPPTLITGCRFKDEAGENVLDIVQRLPDGAKLAVGGRKGPPA